ncbi:virion structural protein [Staphylococcus phage MVC_VPHSA2]|nr:virion structural protein [Staphylococcus phage MVC_VPHSA2]
MAIEKKVIPVNWMEQWRLSDNWWNGGWSPIRAGGPEGYTSFLGTPDEVRTLLATSKTPAKIYLRAYFYYGGKFRVGKHKLATRTVQTLRPFYSQDMTEFTPTVGGYQDYDFTNIIKADLLSGLYQGVVLWNNIGTASSECWGVIDNPYRAYWVVEGDWNVPPERPRIDYPTFGIKVDGTLQMKWTPPTNESNPAIVSYEVAISDDNSYTWKNFKVPAGGTTFTFDTSQLAQTSKALVAIRAYDGEYYSEWNYSDRFTIFHNVPPKAPVNQQPEMGRTVDRTSILSFTWKADAKSAQYGYQFRWRTVDSNGTRGSWNQLPTGGTWANSTNQYYNLAASTLPASNIEWAVRVQDEFMMTSEWSQESMIVAVNPSAAPNMVVPTYNMTYSSARMVAEWTTVGQIQYELFLKNSSGVTLWSKSGLNETAVQIDYTLAANTSYQLQVRINSNGVWSSFVTTPFTVNYAAPAVPVIQRIEEAGAGVTNIVYNQGELGVNLPAITEDGVNLANGWTQRGNVSLSRIIPKTANSYYLAMSDLTAGNNYGGLSIYLDETQVPIVEGATYEVVGYSNETGLRGIIWFYGANGADLGSTADPLAQTAGAPLKIEVHASRVCPVGTKQIRVVFDNVFGSPMSGGRNTLVTGIGLKITSPVATNLIECYRREYSDLGNNEWTLIGSNGITSSVTTNLLPKAQGNITNPTGVTFNSDYDFSVIHAEVTMAWGIQVAVKPNTDYTFYSHHSGMIGVYNADATANIKSYTTDRYLNFNSGNNSVIRCYFRQVTANTRAYFLNHMLREGTFTDQTISFEPIKPDGIQGNFLDYTPASKKNYEYKLTAWNLVNNRSTDNTGKQFTHMFNETILQDVRKISDFNFLPMVTARDSNSEVESVLQRFAGRTNPVREYGAHELTTVKVNWEVDTWNEAQMFQKLLQARKTYLYRDGAGRKLYATCESVDIKDKLISGFELSCEFTQTYYDPNVNWEDED